MRPLPHAASSEVRFGDGRPSGYFDWDDLPSLGGRGPMTSEEALEQAKAFGRAERPD
jgi:hypothetical protein